MVLIEAKPSANKPMGAEEGEVSSRPEVRGFDELAGALGSSGSGANPRAEVAVVAPRSPVVEDGLDESCYDGKSP